MYAVVSSGGKQYRVEAGSTLTMERLDVEPGGSVTFDRVLLVGDGDDVTVGTPTVSGASVSGTVLAEELGPKLVIFKFKQKVKYRRRTGHRQHLVRVRIDEISANGSKKSKAKAKAEPVADEKAAATAQPEAEASVPKARASRAKPKAAAKAKTAGTDESEPAKPRRTAKPKAAKAETAEE